MKCRFCGGMCVWQGDSTQFETTRCVNCGAINSAMTEEEMAHEEDE